MKPSELRATVIFWFFAKGDSYTGPQEAKDYLDKATRYYQRLFTDYVKESGDLKEAGMKARIDTVKYINTFIYEGKRQNCFLEYVCRFMNHDTFQIKVWDHTNDNKQVLYMETKVINQSIETHIKSFLDAQYDFDTTTLKRV